MKYRPEIDGLRALAVLPVVFFHAGFSQFSGGFVGVDVFFVISGYLITTIIFRELNEKTFSLSRFYERRCRRILPALILVSICSIPFAWTLLPPAELDDFAKSLIAVATFSSNILFWQESGYFATEAEFKPLLHTWSLAIEEQYYVLFPIFLMVVWKSGIRATTWMLTAIFCISLALAHFGSKQYPSATFYLLPSRGWELLVGSFAALFLLHIRSDGPRFLREILSALGLGMIFYSIFAFDETTPFPSLYTLLPTFGTALVIVFAQRETIVKRVLSNRVFVGLGLVSYSFYLWHQPIFAYSRIGYLVDLSHQEYLVLIAVAFALAVLTYRFVEVPFRWPQKVKPKKRTVLAVSASGLSLVAALGFALHSVQGATWRVAINGEREYAIFEDLLTINYGIGEVCSERRDIREVIENHTCQTARNPEILLWGDSFAMHLFQMLEASDLGKEWGIRQIALSQCSPNAIYSRTGTVTSAAECASFNDQVLEHINESEYRFVFLASPFKMIGRRYLDRSGAAITLTRETVERSLADTADLVREAGATPVFVAPPPVNGSDLGRCVAGALWRNIDPTLCDFRLDAIKMERPMVYATLETLSNHYLVVDFRETLCPEGNCFASIDSVPIFRDQGHFSVSGSRLIGEIHDPFSQIHDR